MILKTLVRAKELQKKLEVKEESNIVGLVVRGRFEREIQEAIIINQGRNLERVEEINLQRNISNAFFTIKKST